MKRVGLLFVTMFVLSVAVFAQTITITLSDATSGSLDCSVAGLNNITCYFNSTAPGRPWLEDGNYSGQVSWMQDKDRKGIIISGNGISSSRGINIHLYRGDWRVWSEGCVVIDEASMDKLHSELQRIYGGPTSNPYIQNSNQRWGDSFTIRVIDNRASNVQRTPSFPMIGRWNVTGRDTAVWNGHLIIDAVNGQNFSGYFDWYNSRNEFIGKEYFRGTYNSGSKTVEIRGYSNTNPNELGIGIYKANLSRNGYDFETGTWGGPGTVPGTWEAKWQNN